MRSYTHFLIFIEMVYIDGLFLFSSNLSVSILVELRDRSHLVIIASCLIDNLGPGSIDKARYFPWSSSSAGKIILQT